MDSVKAASPAELSTELREFSASAFLKRAFDLSVACISLVCVGPVLLVAMLAIVVETGGSPIFTQARIGQRGKFFKILKLRTMFAGTESLSYKTESADARLTRVGAVLRKLNLDELPQLVNIIVGEMSVIGPRPLSVAETEFLVNQAEFSRSTAGLIPVLRPGLVGLEQVNRTGTLTYQERFEYNHAYESNWRLSLDAYILWKAVQQCAPVWASVVGGGLLLSLFFICR